MPFIQHGLFYIAFNIFDEFCRVCWFIKILSRYTKKVNHLIQAFTNKNNNQTDTEENRQIDCSELPSKIMTREIITRDIDRESYRSPILIEIEKKQNEHDITSMLPPIESLCEYCPSSLWFITNHKLQCFCNKMHYLTYSKKDQKNPIQMCDGQILGLIEINEINTENIKEWNVCIKSTICIRAREAF